MIPDWHQDPWGALKYALSWLDAHLPQVIAALAAAEGLRLLAVRLRHRRLARDARYIEILAPPTATLTQATALWSNLIGLLRPAWKRLLLGQPHLSLEYLFDSTGARICLWVPGVVPQHLVEQAVEAAWPSARTHTIEPVPPVPLEGYATGGSLVLARPEALPLRHRFDTDPLRALLGAATGMPPWQHAAIQILARPATGRRLSAARGLTALTWLARELLDLISPGHAPSSRSAHPAPADRAERLEETAQARAVHDKALQPRYEVAIRYAVAAETADDHEQDLVRRHAIRGRAHALASAFAVFAGHNRLERRRLRRAAAVLDARSLSRGQLMSVAELAALAHIPTDGAVPGLRRAGANSVPPSPQIAYGGAWAKPFGEADAGHARPVALRVADSFHHVHVLGPNGTGKSTLLAHMILSDVLAGRGTAVIDAKGDLITDLLGLIPEEVADRVVLIDPDDRHPRPALNVLQGDDRDMAADNLVGIFHQIYRDFWGPRTDDILRGCCLTLARADGTLADVPRLLTDRLYRHRLTSGLGDPLLRGFWSWYEHLTPEAQAHVTGPIMNKLRAFLLRPFVRDVLGSARSTFNVGDILDGGLLLVRLPKGVLGDESARLLGSLVLAQVWQAAAARARLGRHRAPAAVYVDECQNFLTLPHALSDMLAEARAYRVSLTLAHQHLAQLPRDLRQALSSDARNKIYFSLSPEDAGAVERHFAPHLTAHDLANLGAYQAAARLVVHAADAPPFTLRTQPLPQPDRQRADRIRAAASAAHGRTAHACAPRSDDPRLTPDPRLNPGLRLITTTEGEDR
ncbi:type IV secretory system conjugative DNA transfer family protein [Bailinhaonella thermotolerans]|uniref:Type IV secretory system conjugative DNA transfer family protein n=1 Tax=Bailinhaonella thermotolerans TaxID=1070861 RepID=A0A3A4AWZ1_9ACTN|nr:type IV secretion system DNA-binding domain-containing protein [Bailinhaonella thermotolerans]RJL31894.1 type IV secretory system conjugative DNA transfer family protein [Bailinhaonella thermotolerans]